MKLFVAFMLSTFLFLQYQLWVDPTGVRKVIHLSSSIVQQKDDNQRLHERNEVLAAEVEDLKSGYDAIEERARMELGMIRQGETFFQVIDSPPDSNGE